MLLYNHTNVLGSSTIHLFSIPWMTLGDALWVGFLLCFFRFNLFFLLQDNHATSRIYLPSFKVTDAKKETKKTG